MNKNFMKKLLSAFLALTMMLTSAPVKVSATGSESSQETEVEQISQNLVDVKNTTEEESKKSKVATFVKNGLSILAAGAAAVLGFLYYKAQNDFNALKGQDNSKRIAELNKQVKEQKKTINSLNDQNQEFQGQIGNYEKISKEQLANITDLNKQVGKKDNEIASWKNKFGGCEKSAEAWKKDYFSCKKIADSLMKSNSNNATILLQKELNACRDNLTLWQNDLDTCKKEKDDLTAQLLACDNTKDEDSLQFTNKVPQNEDCSPVFVPSTFNHMGAGCLTFSNFLKIFKLKNGREMGKSFLIRSAMILAWELGCYGINLLWGKTGLKSTSDYIWDAMNSVKSSKAWDSAIHVKDKAWNGTVSLFNAMRGKVYGTISD